MKQRLGEDAIACCYSEKNFVEKERRLQKKEKNEKKKKKNEKMKTNGEKRKKGKKKRQKNRRKKGGKGKEGPKGYPFLKPPPRDGPKH